MHVADWCVCVLTGCSVTVMRSVVTGTAHPQWSVLRVFPVKHCSCAVIGGQGKVVWRPIFSGVPTPQGSAGAAGVQGFG